MSTIAASGTCERRRLCVSGVVQGVGFRPHVHRLASELGLVGFVLNDAAGVVVEVEGPTPALDVFAARLVVDAPPLAVVERVESSRLELRLDGGFSILASGQGDVLRALVPPDIAVCDDCLAELFDPGDRRYRYPFVNCTNCGPRFTIITALPYDRARTTMAAFPLCAACAVEYADPSDRRFHAEPVACPACGPQLGFSEARSSTDAAPRPGHGEAGPGDAALLATQAALGVGRIVAVKGIGGYHLACDARHDEALEHLRRRKCRPDKPFAVMVRDLAAARRLARISEAEAAVLESPQRPIVLLERLPGAPLSPLVAPGNPRLGLLLPYSPLHHLLFAPVPGAVGGAPEMLVMTSGNASEEPIAYADADARERLGHLADAFLVHDRSIEVPCDDSVVLLDGDAVLPLRRSRGYAPLPVRLPVEVPPMLAVGGETKNTACLASGDRAFMSQHIGDMGSLESIDAFERTVGGLARLYALKPRLVVADAHPGYHSRRRAEERAEAGALPLELVQHHHAHVAAVMAEHQLAFGERVLGFAFDGTGYGEDGAIWGGEVLVASYEQATRAAHLAYVPLPGGDAAVRKPYRVALAFLHAAGIGWVSDLAPVRAAPPGELEVLAAQLQGGAGCIQASSMGRLFDAVAALVGLRQLATYEAQPAIELEGAAIAALASWPARRGASRGPAGAGAAEDVPYRFGLDRLGAPGQRSLAGGARPDGASDGTEPVAAAEIDPRPLLAAIVADVRAGRPAGEVALGFHRGVAAMMGEVAARLGASTGISKVVLCGGVFQNLLLLRLARAVLEGQGLHVLSHAVVPPNDGGLALGQVVVAGTRATRAGSAGRA